MDKQYRRALTLLKGSDSDLIEQDVRFRYLAAKCLVECREWEECLMMVGGWEEDSLDSIDMQVLIQCLAVHAPESEHILVSMLALLGDKMRVSVADPAHRSTADTCRIIMNLMHPASR